MNAIRHKSFSHRLKSIAPAMATTRIHERRRGVDIGLIVKVPTTKKSTDLKTLEKEIKTLEKAIKEDKDIFSVINQTSPPKPLLLKPAFNCDRWDSQTRTCWLDRNTGDTVTLSLSTGFKSRHKRPEVIWKREFAQKGTGIMKEYAINPQKSSRNLVIGRRGYELRVSPITEIDVDDNQFSAAFVQNTNIPSTKVNFRIRVMAEDLGFVYIGETIDLSIESFITLPLESISYHWYTEKEGILATLPSNMRVSATGETLRISELRQEQEGVVTCSMYTNKNIHATKKRFLIKELTKNKDVLKAFSSHNITYQETVKRRKKTLEQRIKRITHNKAEESHKKTQKKRNLKKQREINEANVEGERYTIIRSDGDATYDMSPKAQNAKQFLSFSNGTDINAIVNINMNQEKNIEDDKVSQIVSNCVGDLQCSKHASCIRTSLKNEGFCRCLSGFYGPGIFCREQM